MLGGAGSGKSDLAERLAVLTGLPRVYLATAEAYDDEMRAKVAAHRASRGPAWSTQEAPLDLVGALSQAPAGHVVLIDCLTMWLSNHLLAGSDLAGESARLLGALRDVAGPVVAVSNEVGQGIVPDNALARRFRTAQGRLNRDIAAQSALVIGVMAGLPFALKGPLPEEIAQ